MVLDEPSEVDLLVARVGLLTHSSGRFSCVDIAFDFVTGVRLVDAQKSLALILCQSCGTQITGNCALRVCGNTLGHIDMVHLLETLDLLDIC